MDRTGDHSASTIRLSSVAAKLRPHLAEIGLGISEYLVAEIPRLRSDDGVVQLLRASVTENVATVLDIYEYDLPPDTVEGPAAAREYARRLAQRDTPINALIRAYRIGHCRFLRLCLDELHRQRVDEEVSAATTTRMLTLSFDYIDRVTEDVIGLYQRERDHWLLNQFAGRAARVRDVLGGGEFDLDGTEATLGYRLRQAHLGLVSWLPAQTRAGGGLDRLERFTGALAEALDCPAGPLFVPRDETLAWTWLPLPTSGQVSWEALADVVEEADPSVRICAGNAEQGVEGFRRTHRQALRAQELAVLASPGHRFTAYARVAPIALMCANTDDLRAWVWEVLGPLAVDDEHAARLRETLRVFLAAGCSYTAAASRQILHKNTVQYRIRKAEEAMGQTVQERRTDLDVALLAVEHLGEVLLRKKPDTAGEPV